MGKASAKRKQFLSQHPLCCFCGGETPSAEEDHVPSRAFFTNRQWPEGYVFPACVNCNRVTRNAEAVLTLIVRLTLNSDDPVHEATLRRYAATVERNNPGLVPSMIMSARQRRNFLTTHNIALPPNTAKAEAPLLSLGHPVIDRSIRLFGRKMMLALHYFHLGQPLSADGCIVLRWYTNLEFLLGRLPEQVSQALGGTPKIVRANTSLQEQFYYFYAITECALASAYLIVFRNSFAILGFVYSNRDPCEMRQRFPDHDVFGAFNHYSHVHISL